MARHNITLIATLLALVLFIAQTTASRKEEQPSCREKIKSLNLKHCEKHLIQRIQDEDEDMLRMKGINHIRRNRDEEDLKGKCCDQLSEVNNKNGCRCKALQVIMDNLSDRLEKREMYEMEEDVRNLPSRCKIAPPSRCDLSFDQD